MGESTDPYSFYLDSLQASAHFSSLPSVCTCVDSQGARGEKGVSGEKGSKGEAGFEGPPGIPGRPGPVVSDNAAAVPSWNWHQVTVFIDFCFAL